MTKPAKAGKHVTFYHADITDIRFFVLPLSASTTVTDRFMRKQAIFILFICFSALASYAAGGRQLELADVVSGKFSQENIYGVIPIPGDGEHYSQQNAEGTQIIKYSFKTGEAVEVLFDASTARECPFKRFDSYSFSPKGDMLLIATETQPVYRRSYVATHYLYSLKRNFEGKINNVVQRLSDGGPQQVPVFSPDGSMVAFVRDNNIFLVKLLYGNSESQVTEDGRRNEVLNGIPDWVYEEEFAFNRALEFSADSKMLAFVRFDESQVSSYAFPLFAGQKPRMEIFAKYPGFYTYKYPKTGEANSKVSVHTFDIRTRVTRQMQVPLDEDGYIFIRGRRKNVIVLKNGKNVYPEEMEVLLTNLPYVTECMVFGQPRHKDGDHKDLAICAKIVYDKEYMERGCGLTDPEAIHEHIKKDIDAINEELPVYKQMLRVITTDEPMIKTTTGKVKRHEEAKNI